MDRETKNMINKRKIAYVYLMHRMFEGSPALLMKTMKVTGLKLDELEDWDRDYRTAVYETIKEEDARGADIKDPDHDVPSIRSIKEKILTRVEQVIAETTDPARLASAYKVLSEFEVADERKDKSVLDAINEAVTPLTQKQKEKREKKTMLDKMREQGRLKAAPEEKEEDNE